MSLPKARPWVIMALIFLLGAVTGSLLTIGFGSHFARTLPGTKELVDHRMMFLAHRLNLTDAQQEKIRPIVMDAEKRVETVYHQDVGTISKIMADANAQIAQVLTPEQQAALKQLEAEREKMFFHHMHGHGPGDDFHHHGPDDHPPGPPPAQPPTGMDSATNAAPQPGGQ
jgi:Spy/CpxP family protein refolding chaperone